MTVPGHASNASRSAAEGAHGAIPTEVASTLPRRSALETLYRSQAGRLLRFFTRRANGQDAGDLLQETFARYTNASASRAAPPDCPESYLSQVAVSVLRDRGRSTAHRVALRAVSIDKLDISAPDVEAQLEARDMLVRLEVIMLQLKPMTRSIFIARRYHGFSRAEIAAQTGLSAKAIDKHLARAVDHIDRHLGERSHG